jgi:RHS repeat-associated protein
VGNRISTTDENGNSHSYSYDPLNRLINTTDPLGHSEIYSYDPVGNRLTSTNKNGYTTSYSYDPLNRLIQVEDAHTEVEIYSYDPVGNLIDLTDRNNHSTTYSYDSLNRLISTVDASGNETSYVYDAVGNLVEWVDRRGYVTRYSYDPLNRLIQIQDPLDQITTYSYDPVGNRISSTDKNDYVTSYSYDPLNRLITIEDPLGETKAFSYDASGNLAAHRNQNGHSTSYSYDPLNRLATVTDPLGNTVTYSYDAIGNCLNETNKNGYTTSYSYDPLTRLTSIVDAAGNITIFSYDPLGSLLNVTNRNGYVMEYEYDALQQLKRIQDPTGNTTEFIYDAVGNLRNLTNANNGSTLYSYDALNRLISTTDPLGYSQIYSYDPMGNRISYIDQENNTYTFHYDPLSRLNKTISPLGLQEVYSYDPVGNQIGFTDKNGNTYSYSYDPLNRLNQTSDPRGYTEVTVYDPIGNCELFTDKNGNTYLYSYDPLNHLINFTNPVGSSWIYTYDAVGNVVSRLDPNGNSTVYGYSELDLVISVSYQDATNLTFSYDAIGNLIQQQRNGGLEETCSYEYDSLNRLISAQVDYGLFWKTLNYTYDAIGNMLTMTYPDGRLLNYGYDAGNRLILVLDPVVGLTSFTYDGTNLMTGIYYPNGFSSSYEYDSDRRLTKLQTYDATLLVFWDYSYTYDNVGNLLQIDEAFTGKTTKYGYDSLNQLLNVTYPSGDLVQYEYDGMGNRLSETINGIPTFYSCDAASRMLTYGAVTYTYDDVGNRITKTDLSGVTTYQYDGENRLTNISVPFGSNISYQYSAYDTILWRSVNPDQGRTYTPSIAEIEGWAGIDRGHISLVPATHGGYSVSPSSLTQLRNEDRPIEKTDGLGNPTSVYVFGPWRDPSSDDLAIPISVTALATPYVYLANHDATVTNILNMGGFEQVYYEYDAFGVITLMWGAFPENGLNFRGLEYETETGLYVDDGRFYEPETGRYLSPDGTLTRFGSNPYTFHENNPVGSVATKGAYELDPDWWVESFFDVYCESVWDFPAESFFDVATKGAYELDPAYWLAGRDAGAFSIGADQPRVNRLVNFGVDQPRSDFGSTSSDQVVAGTFLHELGHNINSAGALGEELLERNTGLFAAIPLLRVTVDSPSPSQGSAFCSTIPFLDVIEPSGSVVTLDDGTTTDVTAAIPMVNVDTLRIMIDGVDILQDFQTQVFQHSSGFYDDWRYWIDSFFDVKVASGGARFFPGRPITTGTKFDVGGEYGEFSLAVQTTKWWRPTPRDSTSWSGWSAPRSLRPTSTQWATPVARILTGVSDNPLIEESVEASSELEPWLLGGEKIMIQHPTFYFPGGGGSKRAFPAPGVSKAKPPPKSSPPPSTAYRYQDPFEHFIDPEPYYEMDPDYWWYPVWDQWTPQVPEDLAKGLDLGGLIQFGPTRLLSIESGDQSPSFENELQDYLGVTGPISDQSQGED